MSTTVTTGIMTVTLGTADTFAEGSGLGIDAPTPKSRGVHGGQFVELQKACSKFLVGWDFNIFSCESVYRWDLCGSL